jgi:hypothetical protein
MRRSRVVANRSTAALSRRGVVPVLLVVAAGSVGVPAVAQARGHGHGHHGGHGSGRPGVPGHGGQPASDALVVASGQTYVVPQTETLGSLTVQSGGTLVAPEGKSLSLTVDGVETGSVLTATGGTDTTIAPGTYRGTVVLTVADANPVPWQALVFPLRQALYVGADGVDAGRSVLAGVSGPAPTADGAHDIAIRSTGEAFNGVYVKDHSYTLTRPQIALNGNGRSDFVGYGFAITATGSSTRLVVDGANVANQGAVRTGVVADGGANVIVKNSRISTRDGALPADYQPTVDLTSMESAPWMLGISGNVRTTNLLGTDTKASYINSTLSSTGWGVLSTDSGQDGQLTAIDSDVAIDGPDGYGSYAIGNATERFLGTRFDVASYGTINRGGAVFYGDSTKAAVAQLNTQLDLGLSQQELDALPVRPTVIDSRRFGVMWHGAGSVDVSGATQLRTRETTFLDKGQQVTITVDGSQGARVTPANGTLLQVMEDDDPGPQMVDGTLLNTGVYHEPTTPPAKRADFDVTSAQPDDATATFSHTTLKGDFFNAMRGGGDGGSGPGTVAKGKNLDLTFDDTSITGAITASTSRHAQDTITAADYRQLGEVTNTPGPVVNNGVLVTLTAGARWTPTATSYLSRLSVGADASVTARLGHHVAMTVDGMATPIVPGQTYTGAITVTVS